MKHNLLFLIAIAFCATACSSVRTRPPQAYSPSEELKHGKQPKQVYEQYQISRIDGLQSRIGRYDYSGLATVKYYSRSGANDAAEMAFQALNEDQFGKHVEYGSLISGAVLGFVGGAVFARTYTDRNFIGRYQTTDDNVGPGLATDVVLGTLSGLAIGGFSGWSFYHWHFHRHATLKFGEAANAFNKQLAGQLNLSISPMPGGASGAIKFTY